MNNKSNTPARTPDLNHIAGQIEKVILNTDNRIMGPDALLMFNLVEELRAAACQHRTTDLYHFNATRSSGSCNDCGADVRTPAQ